MFFSTALVYWPSFFVSFSSVPLPTFPSFEDPGPAPRRIAETFSEDAKTGREKSMIIGWCWSTYPPRNVPSPKNKALLRGIFTIGFP